MNCLVEKLAVREVSKTGRSGAMRDCTNENDHQPTRAGGGCVGSVSTKDVLVLDLNDFKSIYAFQASVESQCHFTTGGAIATTDKAIRKISLGFPVVIQC